MDQSQKFEQLSVVRDEILTDPNVEARVVWDAAKLALEDDYLNDLMLYWMKQTDTKVKSDTLNEIVSYTSEKLRMLNLLNENN